MVLKGESENGGGGDVGKINCHQTLANNSTYVS